VITEKKHRLNERIRVPQVRLIDPEGNQLGVVPTEDALRRAQEADLDLVEVAPNADPPVCRLMDYGKFAYRTAKEQKQRPHHTQLKEVKFRPKIDEHDFNFKLNHIIRFLGQGHMVKATVMFRGREVVHPEYGRKILDRVMEELDEDSFKVEKPASMEGRLMTMVLTPKRD
jgi:translation initiation factor IF-3